MPNTTRCKRCHRVLTDPKSVARGYGPVCGAKVAAEVARATSDVPEWQMTKALTLIASGAISRPATGSGGFYAAKGYRTDARLCTCQAGRYGRRCYHSVAATILDAVRAA